MIARSAGTIGTLTAVGRALSWQENEHCRLQVTIVARDGKTTIRAQENIGQFSGGLTGGLVGGGVAGVGGPLLASFAASGQPAAGVAASAFRRVSRSKQRRLRNVVEHLALHIRNSIASTGPARIAP